MSTRKRLYVVQHKDFEVDQMKKVEDLKINMWRPYFYDNYNRVGNCTIVSLTEHVDALIKVLSSQKCYIGK